MALTQAQYQAFLDKLEEAFALGAREVEYEDRKIVFDTTAKMLQRMDWLRKKLGIIDGSHHDRRASSTKGL